MTAIGTLLVLGALIWAGVELGPLGVLAVFFAVLLALGICAAVFPDRFKVDDLP